MSVLIIIVIDIENVVCIVQVIPIKYYDFNLYSEFKALIIKTNRDNLIILIIIYVIII